MAEGLPRLDRTALSVTTLHDEDDERFYWLSRTPHERPEALEQQRRMVYGYDLTTSRLQRLLEISERSRG